MGKASKATRRKRRRTGFFIFEIIVLLLLICALFVYAKVNGALGRITGSDLNDDKVEMNDGLDHDSLKGYTNIALVGLDTREDGDEPNGSELMNSDTMIICSISHDRKEVKLVSVYRDTYLNIGDGVYTKANEAYPTDGPESFISMLNTNLDMNIKDFITVNFSSVVHAIDILGGIDDVELTRDEIIHLNNYCVGTAKATGESYETLPEAAGVYDLSGVQAVSYARIRYGDGLDFRRAARQRLVIDKMVEKAKKAGPLKLNKLLDEILQPEYITSSLSSAEMMNMGLSMITYDFAENGQVGFPFHHLYGETIKEAVGQDVVLPVTLEVNVVELHNFLYPDMEYEPSKTVHDYSEHIIGVSGYGENSIPSESEDGTIPPLEESE